GADLVTARGLFEIVATALQAMDTLLHGNGTVIILRRDDHGLRVFARADGASFDHKAHVSPTAQATLLDLAAVAEGDPGVPLDPTVQAALGLTADCRYALAFGLRIDGHLRGVALVVRPKLTARPSAAALRSLATQLALALESAALTEEVHLRRSESRFAAL